MMNAKTLAETVACLRLDSEDAARLALWFTSGANETEHETAARLLLTEAAKCARPDARTAILNAVWDVRGPTPTLYRDKRDGQLVSVVSAPDSDTPGRTSHYSTRRAPDGTWCWEVEGVTYWYEGWTRDNGSISDGWRDFLRHHEPMGTER